MNKKTGKTLLKILLFIILVNLPYITITTQMGIDCFLDSFEHPEYYQYIQDTTNTKTTSTQPILLIQKASHPTFSIQEGDSVLYYTTDKGICTNTISHINTNNQMDKCYTTLYTDGETEPIPEQYVIGKVIGVMDDNIWNALSLTTWDASINNLNIRALLTNN